MNFGGVAQNACRNSDLGVAEKLAAAGRLAAAAALGARGIGRSFADKFGGHEAGDEKFPAVVVELNERALGIGFCYDAQAVLLMLDLLPCGECLYDLPPSTTCSPPKTSDCVIDLHLITAGTADRCPSNPAQTKGRKFVLAALFERVQRYVKSNKRKQIVSISGRFVHAEVRFNRSKSRR